MGSNKRVRNRGVVTNQDIKRPTWTSRNPTRIGLFNQVSHYNVEVDATHLEIVLDSLVEVFRVYSLEVTYQDTPTLSAKCRTCLEKLEFNVFVWQSRNSNKIIIELHRVCGDSIPFHSTYSDLIMDTVRGAAASSDGQPFVSSNAIPDPITRGTSEEEKIQLEAVASLLSQFHNEVETEIPTTENSILSTMDGIYRMLASQRYDLLGKALESLIQLTSAATSGLETAKEVSTIILLGHQSDEISDGIDKVSLKSIHEKVVYLAITGRCIDSTTFREDELSDHSLAALVVVAQAVNNIDVDDLRSFIASAESILPDSSLIDMLFERIEKADDALHFAYLASHILSVLGSCQLSEASAKIQLRVDDIERAYQIGSIRHAALEVACSRLLSTIS